MIRIIAESFLPSIVKQFFSNTLRLGLITFVTLGLAACQDDDPATPDPTEPPVPTIALTATLDTITINGTSDLSWNATEASSCTASGGWSGSKNAVSGSETVGPLTENTTFTLSCTGEGGTAEQSVMVSVNPAVAPTIALTATPESININGTSDLEWSVTGATACTASDGWTGSKAPVSGSETVGPLVANSTFTLSCTGVGGVTEQSIMVSVNVPSPAPTIALTAAPDTIDMNGTSTLNWVVTGATSCTASGGWTGSKDSVSGIETVGPLTVDTTFMLACTGAGGVTEQSVMVSVGPAAPVIELIATPETIGIDESANLSWTVTGATSCTASGGWTGSKDSVSGIETVGPLTVDTTFMLACTGAGGVTEQSVMVSVGPAAPVIELIATPEAIDIDESANLSWTVTGATACTASDGWTGSKDSASGMETVGPLTLDTTFTLSCTGEGGESEQSVMVSVVSPAPKIELTANPDDVTINDSTDLSWAVTDATSCTASDGWSGNKNAISGTETVGPLTVDTTFTLSCTGVGGVTEQSITVTASPLSASLTWDPNPVSEQVAGYKLYYGTTSRGCDTDPVDEQFIYSGPQAAEGVSPIIIFLDDLEDLTTPGYRLTNLSSDLPAGVAYYFAITAFNVAGESPYAFEVQLEDLAPPALCDVSAATNTQVILDFSEFVEVASSTATANYTLVDENDIPVNIGSITYDNVSFKNVTLNTDSLTEGVKYSLAVNNVKDFFSGNLMSETTLDFTYTDAPHIKNVFVLNGRNAVKVTFSEKTTESTATLSSNYSLDNSLSVNNVTTPLNDDKNVEVAVNIAFVEGLDYNITVNNITDLFANTIPVDSIFSFNHAFDNSTPLALSAHITNPTKNNSKVYVVFSEEMDEDLAEDINNYAIDNGVVINSATLYLDGRTVVLNTSSHADGDYKITISNITDDSVNTNSMVTTELMYKVVSSLTIQKFAQFQSDVENVERINYAADVPVTPNQLRIGHE